MADINVTPQGDTPVTEYALGDLVAPVLQGQMFHSLFTVVRSSGFLQRKLLRDSQAFDLRKPETKDLVRNLAPLYMPVVSDHHPTFPESEQVKGTFDEIVDAVVSEEQPQPVSDDRYLSALDFHRAFKDGRSDPVAVAHNLIAALEADEKATTNRVLAVIQFKKEDVLAQATASKARYEAGEPLSVFDGVPVFLKDEVDVKGFKTYVGTTFIGDINGEATEDCTVGAKLRAAGMVIAGKTNMHEIGIGTHGHSNAKWGTSRNPHDTNHYCGGSSSGSAAAVAQGLCPFAIGADGGGSIRIPASHCGLFGLKATWGRVSEAGAAPIAPSVGHLGPLCSTATDLMLSYTLIAGPDERFAEGQGQPQVAVRSIWNGDARSEELVCDFVKGKRIGVFPEYFNDQSSKTTKSTLSNVEKEYRVKCWDAVKELEKRGAEIVYVPIPNLGEMKNAHLVTIIAEMLVMMGPYQKDHSGELLTSTRFALKLGDNFTAQDFTTAQAVRRFASEQCEKMFKSCDVFVTPTSSIPAPKVPNGADKSNKDASNATETSKQMKYMFFGNLTGIPGVTIPVGHTSTDQLPVGLQLQASWWREDVLLGFAQALEFVLQGKVHPPSSERSAFVNLLGGASAPVTDNNHPEQGNDEKQGGRTAGSGSGEQGDVGVEEVAVVGEDVPAAEEDVSAAEEDVDVPGAGD